MLGSVGDISGRVLQITEMTCQGGFLCSWIPCVYLVPENSTLFSLLIPHAVTKALGFLPFPAGARFTATGSSEVEPFPDRVNSF